MDLRGIGPAGAARILADVGDVARFPDRNHFASWTGTAPLDASSGEQIRHRLSRAGNRRLNHVLHIAAIAQIRLRHRRPDLLPTQARRGQDPQGGPALPEAPPLRRGLPPARRRRPAAERPHGHPRRLRRAREGTRGRHSHPARPTCTPRSSALRISHNPDPQHRRYPRQRRRANTPAGSAPQPPRRRAGAVKVERPTGRTTLTATSAGAHSTAPTPRS